MLGAEKYDIRRKHLCVMASSTPGLILEIFLFLVGLYLYLFARGLIRFGKDEVRARAEAFRKDNALWMRLLGLALAAIMLLNLIFHVQDLLAT